MLAGDPKLGGVGADGGEHGGVGLFSTDRQLRPPRIRALHNTGLLPSTAALQADESEQSPRDAVLRPCGERSGHQNRVQVRSSPLQQDLNLTNL
jgi:hypothetical protein